jgi:modulator of FtsH protease
VDAGVQMENNTATIEVRKVTSDLTKSAVSAPLCATQFIALQCISTGRVPFRRPGTGPPCQMMKEITTMTEQVHPSGRFGTAVSSDAQRNKVMRNTYWLLALSMLPTVLGAWVGVQTGITAGLGGGLGLIVFLGGAFGFMFAIEKTKNSAAGVPVLLAFTFFMGLMLSRMLAMVLGFSNGSSLVMTAFGGTAGVFFVMASLASVIKRDLSGMGKWLFVGAMVVMVGGIINVFVGSTAGMLALSVAVIGIFSAYMLYDLKQILDGGETNYISATMRLYLDLFNVFQALLALLGIMGGERD